MIRDYTSGTAPKMGIGINSGTTIQSFAGASQIIILSTNHAGGLVINGTSSTWPSLVFQRDGAAKAYIGLASAGNHIITGAVSNDVCVRFPNLGSFVISADGGTTVHSSQSATLHKVNTPMKVTGNQTNIGNIVISGSVTSTNFISPTNTPVVNYVMTATGTNGATAWKEATGSSTGAPLDGTNVFTGTNTFTLPTILNSNVTINGDVSITGNFTVTSTNATTTVSNLTATGTVGVGGTMSFTNEVNAILLDEPNSKIWFDGLAGESLGFNDTYNGITASGVLASESDLIAADDIISVSGVFSGDGSGLTNLAAYAPLANPTFTGTVTLQTMDNPTNTWAVNTGFGLGTNGFYTVGGTVTLGVTGIANVSTSTERYGELTIVSTGTLTFTNPASFKTSDFVSTRVITNGNTAVIAVAVIPGQCTNMAIVQFK